MRSSILLAGLIGMVLVSLTAFAYAGANVSRSKSVVDVSEAEGVFEVGGVLEGLGIGSEDIQLLGEVRVTVVEIQDAAGKYHLRTSTDYRVTGVGMLTGTRYGVVQRAANNLNTVDPMDADAPGEFSTLMQLVITTPREGAIARVLSVMHVTLNPNGTITAYVDVFKEYLK